MKRQPGRPRLDEVCVMDETKGPLIVRTAHGSPSIRLLLRRGDHLVYVTYERTAERDAGWRTVYR